MLWRLDTAGLAALLLLLFSPLVHAEKSHIVESGAWIRGTGSSARSAEPSPLVASVPDDHLFARNQRIDVSFDNPALIRRLYDGLNQDPRRSSGRHGLVKRATIQYGPMITAPHCLGCAEHDNGQRYSIGDLDTPWLQGQALYTEADLKDRCVFYTGVRDRDLPNNQWINNEPEKRLSRRATRFACANNFESIWTIFPGKHADNTPPNKPNDPKNTRNLFEVGRQGGWLEWLGPPNTQRFTYFENMSRAMANLCSGTVYVMSPDPERLDEYGNGQGNDNDHSIWNDVERITLDAGGKVTEAIAVSAEDPTKGWEVDLGTGRVGAQRSVGVQNPPLRKRELCDENLVYELPGEDWFGTGRPI